MSCYLRHLMDMLKEAGVELKGKAERAAVDRAIHELVGVEYKDCPKTWRMLKQLMMKEEFKVKLIAKVKETMS